MLVFAVLAFPLVVGAQDIDTRPTIPNAIALVAPHPFNRIRLRELLPETLEEMVPKADLIVQGKATPARTYLSADQRDLYTDYVVTPTRVILQRKADASRVPGVVEPIILTLWGGHTIIDNVEVTIEDSDLPSFKGGEDLLLLLVYNPVDRKYRLPGDISGAFGVQHGQIQPLLKHPRYERFRGMTPQQFESEVRRLVH
jgi:hypothetical protein